MAERPLSRRTSTRTATPRSSRSSSTQRSTQSTSQDQLETLGRGEGTRMGERTSAEASQRVHSRAGSRRATTRTRTSSGEHVTSRRMSSQNRPRYTSKRNETTSISREQIMILAGAALLVIVLAAVLFSRACSSTRTTGDTSTQTVQTPTQAGGDETQTEDATPAPSEIQAPANMVTSIQDVTFFIQEDGSSYRVMAQGRDTGDPIEVCSVEGQPVSLLAHDSTLFIPENLESGWDVVAFEWGAERTQTQFASGDGLILEAGIAGSTLYIGLDSGEDLEYSV